MAARADFVNISSVIESGDTMPPRDEHLTQLAEAIRELRITVLNQSSTGSWKVDILKFFGLLITLATAFFYCGSIVSESKVTQAILIQQLNEMKNELKLSKENQYDLKAKYDVLQSRFDNAGRKYGR